MMMITSNTKMAIIQFGHKPNEEELKELSKQLSIKKIADWYYFDKTADREFEVAALRPHYDIVYECIDIENFYEV